MIDSDGAIRCDQCGKKLALKLEGQLTIVCPRCHRYMVMEYHFGGKPCLTQGARMESEA